MYRTALRSTPSALRAIRPSNFSGSRRLLSTASSSRKGTWKGAGFRWGLAVAVVYFYNTSPIFADELPSKAGPAPSPFSDDDDATIEVIIEEKRKQALAAAPRPPPPTEKTAEPIKKPETTEADVTQAVAAVPEADSPEAGSPGALEQEAEAQGAFDPETGEINWDCPCLGGMAHGPCGEEFKAAFSCFVYSKEEPKGMDCIDKFQHVPPHMQDCFRKYPEIYGSEIADDEEGEASAPVQDAAFAKDASEVSVEGQPAASASEPKPAAPATQETPVAEKAKEGEAEKVKEEVKKAAAEAVPEKAHDAIESDKTK